MSPENGLQRLDQFKLPKGFRGRPAWIVQLWWLTQSLLFKPLPQACYGTRRVLLRIFGAKIGKGVLIRPGVEVTYPWKLAIGDYCWIGDNVVLYSLGRISVGDHTVISQASYVCAADHDYREVTFPIRARPIEIGSEVWIATDVWIGPGTSIGDGAVVGARSTVTRDLPPKMVCVGNPCLPIKPRHSMSGGSSSSEH